MRQANKQTEMERKMIRAHDGYLKHGSAVPTFGFRERPLCPSDVVERYAVGMKLFAEVRRKREELRVAIEAQQAALIGLKPFHAEALHVARQHFRYDPAKLADFGIERRPHAPGRQRRPSRLAESAVVTEIIGEVIVVESEAPMLAERKRGPGEEERGGTRVGRGPTGAMR